MGRVAWLPKERAQSENLPGVRVLFLGHFFSFEVPLSMIGIGLGTLNKILS